MAKVKPCRGWLWDSNYFIDESLKEMHKKFTPSFEKKHEKIEMATLLGWGYGQKCVEERREFVKQRVSKMKPLKRSGNNFQDWLKKRDPTKKAIKFR